VRPRIFNPTWEDLEKEWLAADAGERRSFLEWFANFRPDFEFADKLALYACTLDEARTHGAPQAVFDTVGVTDGEVMNLPLDQPNRLGEGGTVVNHPTLGWFVVTPNAVPATERPILYHPDVGAEVLAYAVVRVLLPCCAGMYTQLNYDCLVHGDDCPDRVVRHSTFPEPEGRWLLVAQNAEWDFTHCPFCGTRFQGDDGGPGHRRLWVPKGPA
jgi:hypothetical protein